jgi:NAD(P)-dependent dehydrogenase (short-subunit alcohol dehydrogenase family)
MRGLKGKVAIITGSTQGIGAETARRFAEEGAHVVVTGRGAQKGEAVVQEITARGGTAAFIQADLTVEEQVQQLIAAAVSTFGGLHVLVNNAAPVDLMSQGHELPIIEQTTDNMRLLFQAGVYGVFWCCKYAIPEMLRSGGGSIINTSSVAAFRGHPGTPVYAMMKGAINGLTMQLAVDYAPQIRVNGIVVGVTAGTPQTDAILARGGRTARAWQAANLTRLGHASDIAAAAAFLASEDAGVTTGSFLFAEGGEAVRVGLPDLTPRPGDRRYA